MKCLEARLALLEADLQTLRGSGPDPLARHLRNCAKCRAMADAILQGQGTLADTLATSVPPPDLDRIIRLAAGKADAESSVRRHLPEGFRFRARLSVSLALAACLALLFLFRAPALPGPPYTPPPPSEALQVEALEGQTVAVLETSNPEISVVWLF